jgi:hypothetical protein
MLCVHGLQLGKEHSCQGQAIICCVKSDCLDVGIWNSTRNESGQHESTNPAHTQFVNISSGLPTAVALHSTTGVYENRSTTYIKSVAFCKFIAEVHGLVLLW